MEKTWQNIKRIEKEREDQREKQMLLGVWRQCKSEDEREEDDPSDSDRRQRPISRRSQ